MESMLDRHEDDNLDIVAMQKMVVKTNPRIENVTMKSTKEKGKHAGPK